MAGILLPPPIDFLDEEEFVTKICVVFASVVFESKLGLCAKLEALFAHTAGFF